LKARLHGSPGKALTYQSYLRERLPANLASKVTFHGNIGNRRDLVNRYYDADVFAFPPIWDEGFGIPPVEAMAAGTPVVGSRSGAMVETIKHGETGFLVEKNDAQGLADALLRLLEDDVLRERMGRAGRRRAIEHFTWETVAEKLYDRYQRLCGFSQVVETDTAVNALLP
jgi:glycosyltransferase involved in cell wall biosynthesis